MTSSNPNSEYWRNLNEDMAEFRAAHKIEARTRFHFVPGRLITLPGLVLYELEKRRMIESDGCHNYRPTGKGR